MLSLACKLHERPDDQNHDQPTDGTKRHCGNDTGPAFFELVVALRIVLNKVISCGYVEIRLNVSSPDLAVHGASPLIDPPSQDRVNALPWINAVTWVTSEDHRRGETVPAGSGGRWRPFQSWAACDFLK